MGATVPLNLSTHAVAQMDANVQGIIDCANALLVVNGALYYVTRNQIASGVGTTGTTQVYKSTDKTTWALMATWAGDAPGINSDLGFDCVCCVVGTTIYIATVRDDSTVFPPLFNQVLHRYDTVTDAFLTNSSFGAALGANSRDFGISAFNDGSLLVSENTAALFGPAGAPQFQLQIYTPGTDTWSAPTVVFSDTSAAVKQIHDPVSDLAFVFYYQHLLVAPTQCRCLTVTSSLTFTDTLVFESLTGHVTLDQTGLPAFHAGSIVLPFLDRQGSFPFPLRAARSVIGATPVWSIETIEDLSGIPAGFAVQQFDQSLAGGWSLQTINGLLYAFYAVDNGELDSALSQCFLYYRSSSAPGVWDSPLIGFTSAVPGEMLAPFGVALPGFDPAILVGVVNPVLYPGIASLTDFVLFPGAPPPTPPPLIIQLIGWKLYPVASCAPPVTCVEAPSVKRAV
jgi:hypothetical protein